MTEPSTPHETLAEEAKVLKRATAEIEAKAEAVRQETIALMKRMREAGMSWAAIGRTFDVTPQAAMYATGSAVRTPKPVRRKPAAS